MQKHNSYVSIASSTPNVGCAKASETQATAENTSVKNTELMTELDDEYDKLPAFAALEEKIQFGCTIEDTAY